MMMRSPLTIPFRLRTLANRHTSRWRSVYVRTRSSPGLPDVAGSPSQMMAALLRRGPSRWRSRQLYERLICPPINHFANGSFHSTTFLHGLNQWSSFAMRAQNFCGDLIDSVYNLRYCARDLTWACLTNAPEGLNLRPSFCNEVISVCAMIGSPETEVAYR